MLTRFSADKPSKTVLIVVVGTTALICVAEAMLPPGIGVWALIIPTLVLSLFTLNPQFPVGVSLFASAWLLLDLFLIDKVGFSTEVLVRRIIGIVTFISVGQIVRYAILTKISDRLAKEDLKKYAEALALEKSKLERSNRELQQFASVAAHDLRSPVATILTWADMLEQLLPPSRSAEVNQALDIIQKNAKNGSELIEDVLEIARVNVAAARVEKVDLNVLLQETVGNLQNQIEDLHAQVQFARLPVVQGNKTYLGSVFGNLLRNALIYRDKKRTPEILVGFKDFPDKFEFFVKDNGIGIEPQFTERVFEMFRRLHSEREFPGTGIGLAFCKKVIELSGGKIWVDSAPGKGSTFFFTYPKPKGGAI